MDYFLNIVSNPYAFAVLFLCLFAAWGFITFMMGFFGGIRNMLTLKGNEHHVHHAHTRAVHGMLMLTTAFILWEVVRWIRDALT